MSRMEGGGFGVPTARQYSETALRYVGYSRVTTGYPSHTFIYLVSRFIAFITPKGAEYLGKKIMFATRDKQIKEGTYKRVN